MDIWVHCLECHHYSYAIGRVLHHGLSENNLMFKIGDDKKDKGILVRVRLLLIGVLFVYSKISSGLTPSGRLKAKPRVIPLLSWISSLRVLQWLNQLVQGFTSMGQALRQSQELNAQTAHAMHAITDHLAQLGTTAVQPTPFITPTQLAAPSAHITDPWGAPHFREPRPFKGKAADVPKFLQDICNMVQLSRTQLPLEEDRCVYMASFLEDRSPKQCSAAAHPSQYTELLIHVDWSEQMKIDNFYRSLKTLVKDTIMLTHLQDCPKVFKKYVDFIIEIDNHVHCREQERKLEAKVNATKSTTPRSQHSTSTSTTSTSTRTPAAPTSLLPLPQGIPMEIDTTRTIKPQGPLTNKEKDCCHHLGLCSYCGGTGHMAAACPNMSAASKKCFADRKASSQQGKA
ncbi:hypothetical protein DXG03_007664 [Asterophora parasitica]|uniref:CCHC-type domain-containing protein n=1 Tax=Asterophora parasitica TaxID=117018 RepID=A0A9P7K6X2_9AGAR|nr:hypothetical protein DXG03_007664 [Asterophora parasitica]